MFKTETSFISYRYALKHMRILRDDFAAKRSAHKIVYENPRLFLTWRSYVAEYAQRIDATSSFHAFYFLSLASLSYGRGRRQRI